MNSRSATNPAIIGNIRADFPILNRTNPHDKSIVYLDNAATTQKPLQVIHAISQYYTHHHANIHRGIHTLAEEATQAYEATRSYLSQYLGANSSKEIIFTSGCTESINMVAQGFTRNRLNAGDEVLITAMEHHANLIPWQIVCHQQSAQLRIIPMNSRGEIDLGAYENMLTPKTKMVAIVHIANSLGTINPIREMIHLAHLHGIPTLIDGAQSMAHHEINVQSLDCDFFTFSGHKVYGPTGIGVLYGKEPFLEEMLPYKYGGDMIKDVSFQKTLLADLPQKLEAGTPNIAGVIGLRKSLEYISSFDHHLIRTHIENLRAYTEDAFKDIPGLQIIGQAKAKSGIISFILDDLHPHDIATILNEEGIAIRAGHHCTQPVMDLLGIPGTARVSFAMYNTKEEVDHLLQAIDKAQLLFK